MRKNYVLFMCIRNWVIILVAILVPLIISAFVIACGDRNKKEVENMLKEEISIVNQSVEANTLKDKIANELNYTDNRGKEWKVSYHIFYNKHHSNGYVIIDRIKISDEEVYLREGNEKEYIENFINNITEKSLFDNMRTAEDIIISKYNCGEVKVKCVIESSERQKERKTGIESKTKL